MKQCVTILLTVLMFSTSVQANELRQWRFKVFIDEKAIGHHRVTVQEKTNGTFVTIDADFDVKFLFFSAYRYVHNNVETWREECLESITSKTDDNGDTFFVKGTRDNNLLSLTTHAGNKTYSGCIKTFAYWDPMITKSQALLNAQTGELVQVDIEEIGQEIVMVRQKPTLSRQYRIQARDFTIDLWYASSNDEWIALQSTTADGTQLRYEIM